MNSEIQQVEFNKLRPLCLDWSKKSHDSQVDACANDCTRPSFLFLLLLLSVAMEEVPWGILLVGAGDFPSLDGYVTEWEMDVRTEEVALISGFSFFIREELEQTVQFLMDYNVKYVLYVLADDDESGSSSDSDISQSGSDVEQSDSEASSEPDR